VAPRDPADDPLGIELERAYARLSDLERRRERGLGSDEDEDKPDEPRFRPGT
jgi:hypothetical protein